MVPVLESERDAADDLTVGRQAKVLAHECRLPGNRSLNLSNVVAVAVYEAWRQQGFSAGK